MAKNPRADHFWNEKLQKRERFGDFAYSLARIDWQFFTTHTYKNPMPRLSVQYDIFYRWLYQVSKICKVPYGRILMALRGENGERGGRHHPERYAQVNLGHNSKAMTRAYSRKAEVEMPSLSEYERQQKAIIGNHETEPATQSVAA